MKIQKLKLLFQNADQSQATLQKLCAEEQQESLRLLHDNASAHKYQIVRSYLEKENGSCFALITHSLGLCPCDVFLFLKLKI